MKEQNKDNQDILKSVDSALTQVDVQRLERLNNLKQLQDINNEISKLEKIRLEEKYGADHPRVQRTEARITYNPQMFAALDEEIGKAKIKKEPLPYNAWRVHGRVYGKDVAPLKAQTVFISDKSHKSIKELPFACTDDSGYYSITVKEEQLKPIENLQLYLAVSAENQKVVYTAPDPVKVQKGIIDFMDIYISGDTCQQPPQENESFRDKSTAKG